MQREPVLQTMHSAGVLGDVNAEGARISPSAAKSVGSSMGATSDSNYSTKAIWRPRARARTKHPLDSSGLERLVYNAPLEKHRWRCGFASAGDTMQPGEIYAK